MGAERYTIRHGSTELSDLGIPIRSDGRPEQRVPCPQCAKGGRDDALGVNVETGVFHCFRCGWKGRAGGELENQRPVHRIDDPNIAERKRARLRRIWAESVDLADVAAQPVRQYLSARGLGDVLERPPTTLRAHPRLPYHDGAELVGTFPAMLGLFTDPAGGAVTIHATYLRGDGTTKAAVPAPKKLLPVPVRGATRGGAIRLHPTSDVLGVAEGIETALSLHLLQSVPVWAAYCADALERVRLPAEVRTVYIAADTDDRGERAARSLAERVKRWRRSVSVLIVRTDAGDLNDEIRRRGT
jgi:putative DNA primase/helicase